MPQDLPTRRRDPAAAEDDVPVVGLPPLPEETWREPTPSDLRFARLINLFGVGVPLANLGMLQVSRPDKRWAGVGAGAFFAVLAAIGVLWEIAWLKHLAFGLYYLFVVLGLLHPRWPEHVLRAWERFGERLGAVVSIPMFTLIYLVAVTPVALVMRALGKDPLRRKAGPEESYWHERETLPKDRFRRQF